MSEDGISRGTYRIEISHLDEDEMVDRSFSIRAADSSTWPDITDYIWSAFIAMGFVASKEDVRGDASDFLIDMGHGLGDRREILNEGKLDDE